MGQLTKYKGWGEEQAQKDAQAMQGAGGDFWKVEEGRHVVRFLPAMADWESPFTIIPEHLFQVGSRWVGFACPRALQNAPCPACEYGNKLYKSGSKADKDLAYSFFAKKNVYANIVVRAKEETGPVIYRFGQKVWKQLKTIRQDPEFGDFTDPTEGFDVIVTRTGTSKTDTEYTVMPGKQRPLNKDETIAGKWIGEQPPQRKVRFYKADEIKAMMQGDDDEDEDDDKPRGKPKGKTAGDAIDWDDED
jgi:hypothetical protein